MPTTFRSFAEWPADYVTTADGGHITTDDHTTEGEAQSMCWLLVRHGLGDNGRRPIRVWVEAQS